MQFPRGAWYVSPLMRQTRFAATCCDPDRCETCRECLPRSAHYARLVEESSIDHSSLRSSTKQWMHAESLGAFCAMVAQSLGQGDPERYARKSMMHIHNRFFVLATVLVIGATIMVGCTSESAPSLRDGDTSESAASKPPEDYPRITAKWLDSNGLNASTGANVVLPDVVKMFYEDLNWNDFGSKPRLNVELAWDTALMVELSPNSSDDLPVFVLVWTQPLPQDVAQSLSAANAEGSVQRWSKPLKDSEQALTLLQSFGRHDGKLASQIEWSDKILKCVRNAGN